MQEAPLICTCSRFRSHMGATVEAEGGFIELTEARGLVEYLWVVSFQCVNIIAQNGDFCSISQFVLKYLPHPVYTLGPIPCLYLIPIKSYRKKRISLVTSQGQYTFLSITFDRNKIETLGKDQSVRLVNQFTYLYIYRVHPFPVNSGNSARSLEIVQSISTIRHSASIFKSIAVDYTFFRPNTPFSGKFWKQCT